jgi:cyclophilin family peptidyl-prolyl cis-trans isomerase
MKSVRSVIVILLLTALTAAAVVNAQDARTPAEICDAAPVTTPETRTFAQPDQVIKPGQSYHAILCTDAGPIYVNLLADYTPLTVNSFVFLAQKGFYNNTTFHRVIQDFMAQGGDPTATGTGGPGYQFKDEFVGFLNFDKPGWLAMANAGAGTNGSQFFITTVPTPHLNYKHTIFGQVIEGQENVAKIKLRDPQTATEPGTILKTVIIITDPAAVKTTYVAPVSATEDEVKASFANVKQIISPDLAKTLEDQSVAFTTNDFVANLAEGVRADFSDFFQKHKHQFRVMDVVANKACDLKAVQFMAIGYTLDAFATRDDAAAALTDENLAKLALKNGYTTSQKSDNLVYPFFTFKTKACDRDAVHAMTYWQRGRFIATAEIIIPADDPSLPQLDLILSQFVGTRIYEAILADVLRREIQ